MVRIPVSSIKRRTEIKISRAVAKLIVDVPGLSAGVETHPKPENGFFGHACVVGGRHGDLSHGVISNSGKSALHPCGWWVGGYVWMGRGAVAREDKGDAAFVEKEEVDERVDGVVEG